MEEMEESEESESDNVRKRECENVRENLLNTKR
jgi:hypothetical protein